MTPPINPDFKNVWDELRLGGHISLRDGELYATLESRGPEMTRNLALLGYKLVKHARGFYYIEGDSAEFLNKKRLTKIVAFGMVLIEALTQRGGVDEWLFPADGHAHAPETFPVFSTDRHRSLLEQFQIRDKDHVAAVLNEMARLGFAEETDHGEFRFLEPFYRIIDACVEAQRLGAEGLAERAEQSAAAVEEDESAE